MDEQTQEQEQIYTKTCEWCGKTFQTTNKDAYCCSRQCYGSKSVYKGKGRTKENHDRKLPWEIYEEIQHARVKEARELCKYQIGLYSSHLRKEQKRLDHLLETREQRAEAYNLVYHTRKEIDDAYICGKIETAKDYNWHRILYWRVYSDRGHAKRIEWLKQELEKYQKQLEYIDGWREEDKIEIEKEFDRARRKRNTRNKYKKKVRRKEKKLREVKKKQELEERWERYGIKPGSRRRNTVSDSIASADTSDDQSDTGGAKEL